MGCRTCEWKAGIYMRWRAWLRCESGEQNAWSWTVEKVFAHSRRTGFIRLIPAMMPTSTWTHACGHRHLPSASDSYGEFITLTSS